MLLALLAAPAHGFCGTFVGGAGTEIYNSASQVALVRQDGRTTLTMANDFEGAVGEFALVVPVPTVITEEQVHVLDPAVFTRLDAYSGPRLVEYTCDQLYPEKPDWSPSLGCRDYAMATDDGAFMDSGGLGGVDPVEVAERFIVGEYEIVVLTADDSLAMLQWLSDQGYAVSPAAADAIQEDLDQGSYFFAARVDPSLIPDGQDDLSPLQFSYESEAFGLPIRLGTVNAVDAQDLIVYAITPGSDGRVGISNYEEATLDSVCLWQDDDWDDDFGAFYGSQMDASLSNTNEANWVTEYGWHVTPWGNKCDPCPPAPDDGMDPLPSSDVVALGLAAQQWDSGGNVSDFYFTRLHMRYTPEQATQDLALYTSGITENTQQRYVRHEGFLEWEFPLCDGGWVESDPGSCMDEGREYRQRMKYWDDMGGSPAATARAGLVVGVLGVLGLLAARRRRRDTG